MTMNGSYSTNNSNYIVRLRGLPWNTSQNEIQHFLQGCQIRQIQMINNNDPNRTTGEGFVLFDSKEDLDLAKTYDQKMMGSRSVEVLDSNIEEMNQMIKSPTSNDSQSNGNTDNWREPVVRLRGLPYNSSKEDVTRFFNGLEIAQNGIHISSSKPAGEAFVAFANMDNAQRALEFNRMNMGHRYIEVFKSTYAEARTAIMNDTQSMARQRGPAAPAAPATGGSSNSNYNPQRQGNYSGSNNSGGYDNYNHNQYDGPPSNNYNSFTGGNNNYPIISDGIKHSMAISFTMKIRGVPFEAGEKDVFEFFSPVVPIRLEQENTPRGKPPIWYAEFGSREEATEALTYHNKFMGTRYIELFPLYDDGNGPRSKIIRT